MDGRFLVCLISFLTATLVQTKAFAFPENVRHGYVNCTSCHVSPSGTGLLTQYGRALSAELMSTWSYKGEEGVLHGLIKEEQMPEWLLVGGDFRSAQVWMHNNAFDQARFVKMQYDVEAALRYKGFTVAGTFGYIPLPGDKHRWGSRRYYAMYNATDEASIRLGRFFASYGLLIPDHYAATRRDLGFDQNQETDNLELAWVGENWNFFVTGVKSPGETPDPSKENAVAVKVERALFDTYKIGVSGWYGDSDTVKRQMVGLSGILGFTKKLFLLTEFDHQWADNKGVDYQRGFFTFNRLGYEVFKGFIVFGQAEYAQRDLSNGATAREGYGPGFQFFPRPHFEFSGVWEKSRIRAQGSDFGDYAFLQLHYYL